MTGDGEAGYTLMETLVSIAIVLALSGALAVTAVASMRALSQSFSAIQSAVTIARIDRFVRSGADSLHVPYWENSQPHVDSFSDSLYRSRIGGYIASITVIRDSRRIIRGLEVTYTVNNREIRTRALFPAVPVVEPIR